MIPARLEEYREVAPLGTLELLARLAERLRGRRFVHVNASRYGGGSPEILPLPRGGWCSFSSDHKKLAYNRVFREFRTWKRYPPSNPP